ncbi:hypothetical protein VEZ01S_37_00680 [Vibrio ezurae NBRC 102218]|uniref:Uncharacterized protein n=1 Tax=Vibrio ezurae NBRC 102218 TaxID=1219080 RepID=U3CQY2_9VIBR|nr:hypothetical protein VEZ01S_37_00680 [Vibrio ezurae NBRC 102218]
MLVRGRRLSLYIEGEIGVEARWLNVERSVRFAGYIGYFLFYFLSNGDIFLIHNK